ncbi:hypothetical protein BJP48_18990 [Paenibacillus odorifer]|nr:hypothetical protein BJP48_18990 [Paenibacillus odorifer]
MTVNRELRVGATQSPDFLKLARERSGGTRVRCLRLSSLSDLSGFKLVCQLEPGRRAGRSFKACY